MRSTLLVGLAAAIIPVIAGNLGLSPSDLVSRDLGGGVRLSGMQLNSLAKRQSVQCGVDGGNRRCTDPNQCCSQFGYCGDSDDYCADIAGCQRGFGRCEGDPIVQPTSSTRQPTPTSTSTSTTASSTRTSTSTSSSTSTGPTVSPIPNLTPSLNGLCGNSTGCVGSRFGPCCSEFYWCGASPEHCAPAAGCRSLFGECNGGGIISSSSSVTSSAQPTASSTTSTTTPPIVTPTSTTSTRTSTTSQGRPQPTNLSTDGTCGPEGRNQHCGWDRCCSTFGYCGGIGNPDYCDARWCQAQFGSCDP